jgi:hypothetical protein
MLPSNQFEKKRAAAASTKSKIWESQFSEMRSLPFLLVAVASAAGPKGGAPAGTCPSNQAYFLNLAYLQGRGLIIAAMAFSEKAKNNSAKQSPKNSCA